MTGKKVDVDLNLTALSVGLYNIVITDSNNKNTSKIIDRKVILIHLNFKNA